MPVLYGSRDAILYCSRVLMPVLVRSRNVVLYCSEKFVMNFCPTEFFSFPNERTKWMTKSS